MKYILRILFLLFVVFPSSVHADVLYDNLTGKLNLHNSAIQGRYVSESNNFYAGSQWFSTSTLTDVGYITMNIHAANYPTATTSNMVELVVWKGATTTPRDELKFVAVSGYEMLERSTPTLEGYNVQFQFFSPFQLNANENYLFEVQQVLETDHWHYFIHGVANNYAYQFPPSATYSYNTPENEWYASNHGVFLKIESYYNIPETELVTLTLPCETSNISETACEYGYASTSLLEIEGVSTPMQSFYTGTYDVYVGLFDMNGFLIDYTTIRAPTQNEPFNFYTTLEWESSTGYLAYLKACQVPSDGSTNFNDNDCAHAILGYDMSTASTTEMVDFWNVNTERQPTAVDYWKENACDVWEGTDYLNVFKATKCALIWAFAPKDSVSTSFSTLVSTFARIKPWGYLYVMNQDFASSTEATSTLQSQSMNFSPVLGYEVATTTLDFSRINYFTSYLESLEYYWNWILWILAFVWLAYFVKEKHL